MRGRWYESNDISWWYPHSLPARISSLFSLSLWLWNYVRWHNISAANTYISKVLTMSTCFMYCTLANSWIYANVFKLTQYTHMHTQHIHVHVTICKEYTLTSQINNSTNYRHWLISVIRPAQEFFTYMETSPLPVKGCKI
jgi:hypothetical protein